MKDPYFFGYGSLVNRATHAYASAHTARVSGWRRTWKGTTLRRVAYLTAEPAHGEEIEGLIAAVPGHDWAALDERERAYARHRVSHSVAHGAPQAVDIQIYSVEPRHAAPRPHDHPILLSYLDTVIQGYLREFGEAGALRFFDTTDGWDLAVLNDRAQPIYPRAQKLTPEETGFVDRQLGRLAVEVKTGP